MKGNVNPFEWNSREPALQINGLGLRFSLFGAFTDDLDEVRFDVFQTQFLRQVLDINLLCFEVVQDVGQAV